MPGQRFGDQIGTPGSSDHKADSTAGDEPTGMPWPYGVRRGDGFYRHWHDVADRFPLSQAYATNNRFTHDGDINGGVASC